MFPVGSFQWAVVPFTGIPLFDWAFTACLLCGLMAVGFSALFKVFRR